MNNLTLVEMKQINGGLIVAPVVFVMELFQEVVDKITD